MKALLIPVFFFISSISLMAQPGDDKPFVDGSAYRKPFLHCVTEEKHFANYAIEAQSSLFEMTDTLRCKLHLPEGFNKIWKDIEKSGRYPTGEYDYTAGFWAGIRFNFYLDGVKISTAYHSFEKPSDKDAPYTFYFNLNPYDFGKEEGDINYAYLELLKILKGAYHRVVIEAAMPSKNLVKRSYVPIVSGEFLLRPDAKKYDQWKNEMSLQQKFNNGLIEDPMAVNYNIRLKYLADSTMISLFGDTGFKKNFYMACFQNPCINGYPYANTFVTDNPCSVTPQSTCREAVITYKYAKSGVPLTVRMLVTIRENGEYVQIENNPFGKKQVAAEKQILLSVDEMVALIHKNFPNDSLSMTGYGSSLVYVQMRVKEPDTTFTRKIKRDPGYRVIKETRASKTWESGFVYIVQRREPNKLTRVYTFDAVTGELLWIREIYKVPN